jgi:aminocarboxymuconate-semialdehyde decarboxylase
VRARDPLAGLSKLFYDTIVFDPRVLRHVVSIVGAPQLVLGTAYPFDMSEADPIGFVRDSGLPAAEIDQILDAGRRLLTRDAEGVSSAAPVF